MSHDDPRDDPMDDPRLTAHAMGEAEGPLTPGEQAEVDAIRATAETLKAGFAATPMPTLDRAHRAAILQGLSGSGQGLSRVPSGSEGRGAVPGPVVKMSDYSGLGALAATLLLVVGFGIAGATGGVEFGTEEPVVKRFLLGRLDRDGSYSIGKGGSEIGSSSIGYVGGVGGAGSRIVESRDGSGVVRYGGRRTLDDVSNGLDNGGVGVPGRPSGNPSTGPFFNDNSRGDFRGRTENIFNYSTIDIPPGTTVGVTGTLPGKLLTLKGPTVRKLNTPLGPCGGSLDGGGGGGGHQYSGPVGEVWASSTSSTYSAWRGAGGAGGAAGGIQPTMSGSPRLPLNVGTDGFEEWVEVQDEDGIVTGSGPSTATHPVFVENAWIRPIGESALSTFSIDVDTAGYSIVRRCLMEQGRIPDPGALRIEELVNYFPYADAGPEGADPFAVRTTAAACPWEPRHRLVRIALKGREIEEAMRPAANLVFLLDVSGSMAPENKLPLVRKSIAMLTERLTARDRVAMVVYAGSSGLVLPSTPAGDHAPILAALDRLGAGGSTNGGAGIELAYKVAVENFVAGGINRVVLATDGDFNVGVSDPSALVKMVEEKAKAGVFLTALGYGMDNLKDSTLEQLADRGNGNYGYIDGLAEARKVLVEQGMSTLHCIAKDVKIQVEFNPAKVAGYRLLGYENRMLAAQDFADDARDAGEIGAGHGVTAFYEVVPAGVEVPGAAVDELRYQRPGLPTGTEETLVVKLRWKEPEGTVSTPREFPFTDSGMGFDAAPEDFRFGAAVAAFGMVLRDSKCAGSANLDLVREIAAGALGADPGGWRAEFLALVEKAKSLRK